MESLNYACLRKGWGIPSLILILLIAANITYADVTISNSYYTSGSESRVNVVLHNMDYSNDASVFGDGYSASAKASTTNQSETSELTDTAYSSTLQGPQGYSLQARGSNDMGYSRSLSAGSSLFTGLSYNMKTGASPGAMQIKYYNSRSLYDDNIFNLVNNNYTGKLQSYGPTVYISGKGTSNGIAPGSFNDTISYIFAGKDCKMDSFLDAPNAAPLNYLWKTFLNQGSRAVTGINITQSNSSSVGIKGTSSFLDDKFSTAYMRYEFS